MVRIVRYDAAGASGVYPGRRWRATETAADRAAAPDSSLPPMAATGRAQETRMPCPDRSQEDASVQHWREGAVARLHFNTSDAFPRLT